MTLCSSGFVRYLNYCRSLEFNALPDYQYLKELFLAMINDHGREITPDFDWIVMRTELIS